MKLKILDLFSGIGGSPGIKHPRKSVPITIEPENPATSVNLTNDQCRFPLWKKSDEPNLFCGKERWNKSSYCKMHYEKSHVKSPRSI